MKKLGATENVTRGSNATTCVCLNVPVVAVDPSPTPTRTVSNGKPPVVMGGRGGDSLSMGYERARLGRVPR